MEGYVSSFKKKLPTWGYRWKVEHHLHLFSWKRPLLTKGALDYDELEDVSIMESSSLRTSFGC